MGSEMCIRDRLKRKRWPALAGPGLAGDCWFVDPVRFCDWARGLDGVYLLTRRLPRASAATALLLLPVRDGGGSYEVAFAESGVSHVIGSVVVRRTAGAGYPIPTLPATTLPACLIASGLALAQNAQRFTHGAAGLARLHYGGCSKVRVRLRLPHLSAPKWGVGTCGRKSEKQREQHAKGFTPRRTLHGAVCEDR